MQRVRLDVLEDRSGRLHRDGEPFDGIAYCVEGDLVTANHCVVDGVLGGPAEAWDPTRVRALGEAIREVNCDQTDEQFPEEGAYFRGTLFEGVLYSFYDDTGVLRAELDYSNTEPGPSREWYKSGALSVENRRQRADGTTECENWDESGQSRSYSSLRWQIGHSPEGRLRVLYLEADCPPDVLARVSCGVDFILGLSGPGITDRLISRLEELNRVEILRISGTRVSAKGLERFLACVKLRDLTTERNTGFGPEHIGKFLSHFPNCAWECR